ncbi:hypothetical protein SASPL_106051 [Salvia splendens]|uniref:C3H1-type domain-containing protein n=1 Tax=Salvia splendens TaxID=180675 RepID=A0A8X8YRP4_SALSN|nr:hypothetical protein SASPL_106051 [Salvia splendens]
MMVVRTGTEDDYGMWNGDIQVKDPRNRPLTRRKSSEPREEFQIPIVGVTEETQRSNKGRHCKKFYTEEGCTFLHDEQALKPSNWKTSICNKWELTGYCPFGSKCHFAHGAAELHNHGGLDSEVKDASTQGEVATKTSVDSIPFLIPMATTLESRHKGCRMWFRRPDTDRHRNGRGWTKLARYTVTGSRTSSRHWGRFKVADDGT